MIQITATIAIDERDLSERFVRAPGPGGQNVNKVATAVQLHFRLWGFTDLPDDVRERLIAFAGRRVSTDGVLSIEAHRFRTRERNRADALARLAELLRRASRRPTPRKKTRPTRAAKERRLQTKRQRSATKHQRRRPVDD